MFWSCFRSGGGLELQKSKRWNIFGSKDKLTPRSVERFVSRLGVQTPTQQFDSKESDDHASQFHTTELPCNQQTDWTTIAIPHHL